MSEGFDGDLGYGDDPYLDVPADEPVDAGDPVDPVALDDPVPLPGAEADLPATFDPQVAEPIAGDPGADMQLWHQQQQPDPCAVASQEFVLEALTGQQLR